MLFTYWLTYRLTSLNCSNIIKFILKCIWLFVEFFEYNWLESKHSTIRMPSRTHKYNLSPSFIFKRLTQFVISGWRYTSSWTLDAWRPGATGTSAFVISAMRRPRLRKRCYRRPFPIGRLGNERKRSIARRRLCEGDIQDPSDSRYDKVD